MCGGNRRTQVTNSKMGTGRKLPAFFHRHDGRLERNPFLISKSMRIPPVPACLSLLSEGEGTEGKRSPGVLCRRSKQKKRWSRKSQQLPQHFFFLLFVCLFMFIEVQLTHDVILVSGEWHSDWASLDITKCPPQVQWPSVATQNHHRLIDYIPYAVPSSLWLAYFRAGTW